MKQKLLAFTGICALTSAFALAGVFLYERGDELIRQRHKVAELTWKLPEGKIATLSESLALEAIEMAFRGGTNSLTNWLPLPAAQEPNESVLRRGADTNSGFVILIRMNSADQLYATLKLDLTNRTLNVVVSKPK